MKSNRKALTVAIAVVCVLFGAVASGVTAVGASAPKDKAASHGPRGPRGFRGHTGAQGNPGPVGPQGAQGAQGIPGIDGVDANGIKGNTGDPGPRGPAGPAGANGIVDFTKIKYRYNDQGYQAAAGTTVTVISYCQDNERLLTGGGVVGNGTLVQSNPSQGNPPDSDDGWVVQAKLDAAGYQYVEAVAVCVAVK